MYPSRCPGRTRRTAARRRPSSDSTPTKTYNLVFTTNCGSFTITLDQAAAPATSASLVALSGRLLRQHDVPPHRAGLRDPGRRPDAIRGPAAPATKTRTCLRPVAAYVKGVVAMAKARQPSRPERRAASSSSSRVTMLASRPSMQSSAPVTSGPRGGRVDRLRAVIRRPSYRPSPVVDSKSRSRSGHSEGIGAIVLAAGEASRFGDAETAPAAS